MYVRGYVCMHVDLSFCLYVSVCLSVCMCRSVCLSVCVGLSVCLYVSEGTARLINVMCVLNLFVSVCLSLQVCVCVCVCVCCAKIHKWRNIPSASDTCIHKHTYICAYIQPVDARSARGNTDTCMHTYMHTPTHMCIHTACRRKISARQHTAYVCRGRGTCRLRKDSYSYRYICTSCVCVCVCICVSVCLCMKTRYAWHERTRAVSLY